MLPRFPAVTRCLSLAALLAAGPVAALEFPLPPPGEDVIGQVQVIKAKYEDTFADIGTANDLGYLEMIEGLQQQLLARSAAVNRALGTLFPAEQGNAYARLGGKTGMGGLPRVSNNTSFKA